MFGTARAPYLLLQASSEKQEVQRPRCTTQVISDDKSVKCVDTSHKLGKAIGL